MTCPVCGQDHVEDVCGRCGTDLAALLASGTAPELQIRRVSESPPERSRRSPP